MSRCIFSMDHFREDSHEITGKQYYVINFTQLSKGREIVVSILRYIFFQGYSWFFLMVVWGFGFGVLLLVFGVGVVSYWGLEHSGFWGWGSLCKHKRITLGKKYCPSYRRFTWNNRQAVYALNLIAQLSRSSSEWFSWPTFDLKQCEGIDHGRSA